MEVAVHDTPLKKLIHSLVRQNQKELTDGELLECFICKNDKAAFEALLLRHGPMVLGVCRRILRNEADAEDAYQATFLVLARKASSIRPRGLIGNWLYGVARTTALKARAMEAKRLAREREAAMRLQAEGAAGRDEQLLGMLDDELKMLPDKYRAAIVLCELEGLSIKDAAIHLKCPQGTVGTRLTRGRALLAKRLARRGLKVSGGVLTVVLSKAVASASVPPTLTKNIVEAATLMAAGQSPFPGMVSDKVVALTQGVLKAMFLTKLKVTTVFMLSVITLATGGGIYFWGQPASSMALLAAQNQEKPTEKKAPKTDKELLQGTWEITELAVQGKELEKVPDETRNELRAVFDGDNLTWRGSKLTFSIDPSKKPKQMDWNPPKDEQEEKSLCIYELDGDKLKVCIANPGDNRPTEFKSVDGPQATGGKVLVFVFKRVNSKNDK